jgi:hypothetical protein
MNPFVTQTRVNLSGIYPIGLLRLFSPTPTEFTGIANFYQSAVYAPWYAARVISQVWAWGNPHAGGRPQYDAYNGASYYNVSSLGGGFNLANWLNSVFPACNCYDLAAITQLGCCLLLTSDGSEALDSRWVYQQPNGYIKQCVLYGWGELYPYPPGVNNPFFMNLSECYPKIKSLTLLTSIEFLQIRMYHRLACLAGTHLEIMLGSKYSKIRIVLVLALS